MSSIELQGELGRHGIVLPIIFVTGHGDVPMAVAAIKSGAFEFIEKPFNGTKFLAVIEGALRHDVETRRASQRFPAASARCWSARLPASPTRPSPKILVSVSKPSRRTVHG